MPNIVENEKLHLSQLDAQSISQILTAHPRAEGNSFRPFAYLTFALNWYFGADNVLGYHLVNIFLHWATATLLYLTILQLLETSVLNQRSSSSKHLVALSAALLWALNPVQTQAVTYIVQRMAGLAAFLFLAAILSYLIGRRSQQGTGKYLWFSLTLLCFILALGSKENSITLPVVLFLLEILFFRSLNKPTKQQILLGGCLLLVAGSAIILIIGNPLNSIAGYDHRSFTLWQRLLTESRIMVFYLSLLFFPAPSRLSLDHDIALSTSILQPSTTLISISLLAALTIWALWKYKTQPIPAFAILFFLLNHIIESTIFPLELIFEHRNYLPSLFLFLPFSVILIETYESDRVQSKPFTRRALAGGFLLLLCILSMATYNRNAKWETEQTLWEDTLAKAPGQSRPYINLSFVYQQQGRSDEAFALCQQSLTKNSQNPAKDRMGAYNNMGNIAMDRGNFVEAFGYYRAAQRSFENPFSRYYTHKALLANGQTDEAYDELAALIRDNPGDDELMTSMAIVLTAQQKLDKAKAILQEILNKIERKSYLNWSTLICLGSVLSRQGDPNGAEQQFRVALPLTEPIIPLLAVTGNHILHGNMIGATTQLIELLKHYSKENLLGIVQSTARQNILFPITNKELADFIHSNSAP